MERILNEYRKIDRLVRQHPVGFAVPVAVYLSVVLFGGSLLESMDARYKQRYEEGIRRSPAAINVSLNGAEYKCVPSDQQLTCVTAVSQEK